MRDREQDVEDLIEAGRIDEAIKMCESLAGSYDEEEAKCDQAGEYAEGMRANQQADYWRSRARQLKQANAT